MMNETVLLVSMVLLWMVVLFNLLLTLMLVRRANSNAGLELEQELIKPGERAPEFTAATLEGEIVTLATYAGRDVVFLFMSPACEPCRELVPVLESLAPTARQTGIDLLYVSVFGVEETRNHVDELGISLPVVVASHEDNNFMTDYKIKAAPAFCSIDAKSRVRASGYLFEDDAGSAWQRMTDGWKTPATAGVEVAVR